MTRPRTHQEASFMLMQVCSHYANTNNNIRIKITLKNEDTEDCPKSVATPANLYSLISKSTPLSMHAGIHAARTTGSGFFCLRRRS